MQSKQMLPQTTTMQQLWKYSDTLCSSFNTLLGSDGQTDTTTTDQSASPAYSSPGNISTWSQKIENITEGYFPLSVSFVVCTSEKEYMWIYITVKLARPLYLILQERSVTQTRCSTQQMRNFLGEAKRFFYLIPEAKRDLKWLWLWVILVALIREIQPDRWEQRGVELPGGSAESIALSLLSRFLVSVWVPNLNESITFSLSLSNP